MLSIVGIITLFYVFYAKADSIYFQESMMKEVHLEEGTTFNKLRCGSAGFLRTPSQMEWHDETGNNLKSLNDASFGIHQTEYESILSFNASEKGQSGVYICNIRNVERNENKIYDIFIYSKTDNRTTNNAAIIQDVEVLNVTDNSVLFRINTTKQAEEFVAIYVEELENVMMSRKFGPGDKIVFENLICGGKYKFQFLARPRSERPWTKLYTVHLLPAEPEVVLRDVKENSFQIEWLHQRIDPDGRRGDIDKYLLSYTKIDVLDKTKMKFETNRKVAYTLKKKNCAVNIEITACFGSNYTVTNLQSNQLYEIAFQAHNSVGYGNSYTSKIRTS